MTRDQWDSRLSTGGKVAFAVFMFCCAAGFLICPWYPSAAWMGAAIGVGVAMLILGGLVMIDAILDLKGVR